MSDKKPIDYWDLENLIKMNVEYLGELTIVGIEHTYPVRLMYRPSKPDFIEIKKPDKVVRYVEQDEDENSKSGRETCRIMAERASDTDVYWEYTLEMECGVKFIWAGSDNPVYCPYCGGKVDE